MSKTCYMCDKKSTSKEHVPPKCLFPEEKDLEEGQSFRKNLISVPSCDLHNSKKSMDDEYIMFVLACGFFGNEHKQIHFSSKIMRALRHKPNMHKGFLRQSFPVVMRDNEGKFQNSGCFKVDRQRFDKAMHQIACGIFFNHYQKKCLSEYRVFTDIFIDTTSDNAIEINAQFKKLGDRFKRIFDKVESVGTNKEIFSYRIFSDQENRHAIQLDFYQGVHVIVFFNWGNAGKIS